MAEGQRVARGEMIARVGKTGNARTTPPHIHFQINVCGDLSSEGPCTVDPHRFMRRWAQSQIGGRRLNSHLGRQRGAAVAECAACTYRRHFVRTIVGQFVRS